MSRHQGHSKKISMTEQTKNLLQSEEIGLQTEELETVIAPGVKLFNHNETFVAVELQVEELETVIAPG